MYVLLLACKYLSGHLTLIQQQRCWTLPLQASANANAQAAAVAKAVRKNPSLDRVASLGKGKTPVHSSFLVTAKKKIRVRLMRTTSHTCSSSALLHWTFTTCITISQLLSRQSAGWMTRRTRTLDNAQTLELSARPPPPATRCMVSASHAASDDGTDPLLVELVRLHHRRPASSPHLELRACCALPPAVHAEPLPVPATTPATRPALQVQRVRAAPLSCLSPQPSPAATASTLVSKSLRSPPQPSAGRQAGHTGRGLYGPCRRSTSTLYLHTRASPAAHTGHKARRGMM